MSEETERLPKALVEFRKAEGFSVRELAYRTGLSQATISMPRVMTDVLTRTNPPPQSSVPGSVACSPGSPTPSSSIPTAIGVAHDGRQSTRRTGQTRLKPAVGDCSPKRLDCRSPPARGLSESPGLIHGNGPLTPQLGESATPRRTRHRPFGGSSKTNSERAFYPCMSAIRHSRYWFDPHGWDRGRLLRRMRLKTFRTCRFRYLRSCLIP